VLENESVCTQNDDNFFYSYADSIDNPKKLTVEQLMVYNGMENITEEEACQIIDALYQLSLISYKITKP
jgi:hypothetical protein